MPAGSWTSVLTRSGGSRPTRRGARSGSGAGPGPGGASQTTAPCGLVAAGTTRSNCLPDGGRESLQVTSLGLLLEPDRGADRGHHCLGGRSGAGTDNPKAVMLVVPVQVSQSPRAAAAGRPGRVSVTRPGGSWRAGPVQITRRRWRPAARCGCWFMETRAPTGSTAQEDRSIARGERAEYVVPEADRGTSDGSSTARPRPGGPGARRGRRDQ
jgi:hypothetical protein